MPTRKSAAVNKPAARKPTRRKTVARKKATRTGAAKKSAARKTVASKGAAAKKGTARKLTARKPAPRKAAARKRSVRKPLAKRTAAARKVAAGKRSARKGVTQGAAAKRTAAKQAAPRKRAAAARGATAKKGAAARPAAKKAAARRPPGAPAKPRIALLGIHLEANAFSPVSTRADFEETCYLVGEAIVSEARKTHPAMPMEMVSFVRAMDAAGPWQPVPILLMGAEPGGPIEQRLFEETLAEMERRLRAAGALDGVYISNHGANCATGTMDPDGDQFRLVRRVVGARVPIVVTLDLHANLSQEMVDAVDVLIGYRTNPHVDQVERGEEAASTLRELMGGVRAAKAFLRLPLVPVQTSLLTAGGPYAELIDYGQAHKGPAILNVTVLGGFSYADAPRQGLSLVVTARGDERAAQALAKQIAGQAWENRRRFTRKLTSLEDAVALAVRTGREPALPAHILADVSDNPGGGGRGNTVYLLRALVAAGAQGVLLGNFFDPALAAEAHRLGVGAQFMARFNREETTRFSDPLTLAARVQALADGTFVGTRGIYAGRTVSLGPCAALQVGGVSVVVGSHRKQCADPVFFTHLGLQPAAARTVVVKSRGHFRAGFDLLFPPERVIEVSCPGLTTQDLFSIPYRHIDKERLFPFNPDAAWHPPDWVRR